MWHCERQKHYIILGNETEEANKAEEESQISFNLLN